LSCLSERIVFGCKWKKNKIYTEKEYFKVLRDGTNALVCSGIVLKNIEILV
jgi:hypothetical protein